MIDRKCKCGGHICSNIEINELAICSDCNKHYILEKNKWKNISPANYTRLYLDKITIKKGMKS